MKWFAMRFRGKVMWSMVGVMALALINGHAAGQCPEQKLLASDGAMSDSFGQSVSISGDIAIVGANLHDDNGMDSGSAYIYRKSGSIWVEEAKLLATDGAAGDQFGISVSFSGTPENEVAIVGAYLGGSGFGAAYIYRFNGINWVEEQKLLASDGAGGDQFGFAVSIIGAPGNEVAIISARSDNDNGSNSGSAYIYRFNGANWIEEDKLLASDGGAGDFFGHSVSISGPSGNEIAIVGAFLDDAPISNSGSAYIFRKSGGTWGQEQKLLASDGAGGDLYGLSVSMSRVPGNEVAIVGASRHGDNGLESGAAYIYRKSGATWVEEQKLLASDGVLFDNFGFSVSISGPSGNEVVIVGAFGGDDIFAESGSAYVYFKSGMTWVEKTKILASDGGAGDNFGFSVSISDDVAIIGAYIDDDNGMNSGSAYVVNGILITGLSGDCNSNGINDLHDLFLHKTSADCNDNGIPDECDIVSGVSLDVDVDGIPDECLASCPADNTGDGNVNVTDLLTLLAAWGVCP